MKDNKNSDTPSEGTEDKNLELNLDTKEQEKPDPLEAIKGKCSVVYMTPATILINDSMSQTTSIARGGKGGFIRDGKIEVKLSLQDDGSTTAQLTTEGGSTRSSTRSIIGIQNIERFTGDKSTDVKILNYILTEMHDQNVIVGGKLMKTQVDISMQRMVDLGICNSLRAARRSFMSTVNFLTNIKLGGAAYLPNATFEQANIDVLFIHGGIKKKIGNIGLNPLPHIQWGLLSWSQMIILNYYYKLSNRASSLLMHILQDSRQRLHILSRKKQTKNYFKIPFYTIREKLGLPEPEDTDKPSRDIRNVILDAIEEIKAMQLQEHKNEDLELYALHKDMKDLKKCNIEEFLKYGYLRVRMKGTTLKYARQVGGIKDRSKENVATDEAVESAKTIHPEISNA